MASAVLLEIQGLRGIAIISVFLFHLWPSAFPNGYVGVDMFFVISGYLMAMVFSKEHSLSIGVIADFYYKRAKRILPLYYLALPLILIASYLFIGIAWLHTTGPFAVYSLVLLKNMKTIWAGRDYFTAFQANSDTKDIFLHLWSLAVEIQFYLIVPFIFLILQLLKTKELKIVFLLLSSMSFGRHYFSDPISSFYYCPSRLWQFGLGMVAFIAMGKQTVEANSKPIVLAYFPIINLILVSIALIALLPSIIPHAVSQTMLRPVATMSCFYILSVESTLSNKILSHRVLIYFGDISYSLYLIHWPIILLFGQKYSAVLIAVMTLVLSTISYSYYENWYRKLSPSQVFRLFAGLATVNGLVFLMFLKCPIVRDTIDDYYYNQGNGTKKVAVFGNSFTLNEVNTIHDEFKNDYSDFKAIAGLGLFGLYNHVTLFGGDPNGKYHGQYEAAVRVIEDFKPDVLFLVSRIDLSSTNLPANTTKDLYIQLFNKNMARLERASGRIFIHGPISHAPLVHLNRFIDAISDGKDLKEFNLNRKTADDQMDVILSLLAAVRCTKSQVFDVRHRFLDGDHYLTYDPQTNMSFFDNTDHLTFTGLERIRPVYTDLISKL